RPFVNGDGFSLFEEARRGTVGTEALQVFGIHGGRGNRRDERKQEQGNHRGGERSKTAEVLVTAHGRSHRQCLRVGSHVALSLSREPLCPPLPFAASREARLCPCTPRSLERT